MKGAIRGTHMQSRSFTSSHDLAQISRMKGAIRGTQMQSRSFTSSHDLAQISSAGESVGCSRRWNVRFTAIRRRNVSRHSRWLRISYLMREAIRCHSRPSERSSRWLRISYLMKRGQSEAALRCNHSRT